MRRYTEYQNLKLPLCPKCSNTKHVTESLMSKYTLAVILDTIYWCSDCDIEWNKYGIREKDGLWK